MFGSILEGWKYDTDYRDGDEPSKMKVLLALKVNDREFNKRTFVLVFIRQLPCALSHSLKAQNSRNGPDREPLP